MMQNRAKWSPLNIEIEITQNDQVNRKFLIYEP